MPKLAQDPVMTTPEQMVAEWLTKHGMLFIPQQDMMGGQGQAGGAKVDFVLPMENIVIRVQSYFHIIQEAIARDEFQKIALAGRGWTVVDVWEAALRENVHRVMSAAIQGVELERGEI